MMNSQIQNLNHRYDDASSRDHANHFSFHLNHHLIVTPLLCSIRLRVREKLSCHATIISLSSFHSSSPEKVRYVASNQGVACKMRLSGRGE